MPQTNGGFLLARLVTSQLRATPIDTSESGWQAKLEHSVSDAFRRDIVTLSEQAGGLAAANDCLTALACSFGKGLPLREIWPALASAVSAGQTYNEADVERVLRAFGRYIIEAGDAGHAVYRLFHQELVGYFTQDHARVRAADDTLCMMLLTQLNTGDSSQTINPYLLRHGAAHLQRLGPDIREAFATQAGEDPDIFGPMFAAAQSDLAVQCIETAQFERGLHLSASAVALFRQIALAHVELRSHLAAALNVHSIASAGMGDFDTGLASAAECVALYRTLSQQDTTAYEPQLANALLGLAQSYDRVGEKNQALETAHDSLRHWRLLAEQDNDLHQPGLAACLVTLGTMMFEAGELTRSATTTEEAVDLYHTLAASNPYYLKHLASALTSLSPELSALGRFSAAHEANVEAVAICRELVREVPDLYQKELAAALVALSNSLARQGQATYALTAAAEAVDLFRLLHAREPNIAANELATALYVHSQRLSDVGQLEAALADAGEVVDLRRQLHTASPRRLDLSDQLARALGNQAGVLRRLGMHSETVETLSEAALIYRQLASQDASRYTRPLMRTLNNLTVVLADIGRFHDALATAAEQHEIAIQHSVWVEDPQAWLAAAETMALAYAAVGESDAAQSAMAMALTNLRSSPDNDAAIARAESLLAYYLAQAGRVSEALEPAASAVEKLLRLYRSRGAAYLTGLRSAASTAGDLQERLGNYAAAMQYHRLAYELSSTLSRTNALEGAAGLSTAGQAIAGILIRQGQTDAAVSFVSECLERLSNAVGSEQAEFLWSALNIAVTWMNEGIYDQALTLLEPLVQAKRPVDAATFYALALLTFAYQALNRREDSGQALQRLQAMMEQLPEDEPLKVDIQRLIDRMNWRS
ncbi:hypothetical protein [Allorhizocola rhizosphaerae]|uniref:hypothetical protein n=1 Tax=Allorhizocola rhizosphaerae TaxID=1872709 RepID=UPI0013C2A237|nr:hypothetical protein [Allorhizocola rhizosphaerae]